MKNTIIWTPEKKEQAIELLTGYFEKYGVGEMISQNDNALIEAPSLLVNIADKVLKENEGIQLDL